jgi:hypothetical protein
MWAGATFWAGAIGHRIHSGQVTADAVGGLLILLIALIVRWENDSWIGFVMTLIPVFGFAHSLGAFWRLPAKLAVRE